MLSTSVADYSLSPLINCGGVATSWHKPFNSSDVTIYGLHTAFPTGKFFIASGINYLDHPDYRWQDEYLGFSLNYPSLALGATQHLVYEKIGEESWFTWDNDYAVKIFNQRYGAELRYQRCRTSDAAWAVSAQSCLSPTAYVSSSYTWRKHDSGTYAVATSYQIVSSMLLQSSWQSTPARFGAGVKFTLGKLGLMYGIRSHPELALTHTIDLEVSW